MRRNFLSPFLLAFDTPIPFSTVGRRQVSNVPAQALILLNDPFVHEQAGVWATSTLARTGDVRPRNVQAHVPDARSAGRRRNDELGGVSGVHRRAGGPSQDDGDDVKPWADLAHTLFNTKEFIYLD